MFTLSSFGGFKQMCICVYLTCTSDQLAIAFVISQMHVAKREVAKCPLVDKLCNINTYKAVSLISFLLFTFFIHLYKS